MANEKWNGSIKDMPLILHPELIAAAFKKKEADLYLCWVVLKALDACTEASGHRDSNNMILLFQGLLNVGKSRAYQLLEEGVGRYWNRPNGKKGGRTTSLFSYKKVIKYLEPTMTKTAPFSLRFSDLESSDINCCGWKYIRSLMLSLVAARFPDTRPTTYATLSEHTGLTNATIRRNLLNCIHLQKYTNFEIIDSGNCYATLRDKMYELIRTTKKNCYFIPPMRDGKYYLVKQLPNSYELSEFERASCKKRPKELRQFDKINGASCSEKKYYDNLQKYSNKNTASGSKKYVSAGYINCNDKGTVFMWEAVA